MRTERANFYLNPTWIEWAMDDLQNVTEICPKIENFAVAPSVPQIAVSDSADSDGIRQNTYSPIALAIWSTPMISPSHPSPFADYTLDFTLRLSLLSINFGPLS
jgi:hypothetical protein